MGLKPIDFQGIISLDYSLLHQMECYLSEKESAVADQIAHLLQAPCLPFLPSIPESSSAGIKLSDAIDQLAKKIRHFSRQSGRELSLEERKRIVRSIDHALWEYVELLSTSAVELFQLVQLVDINYWEGSLPNVVELIKELLLHQMEDLTWSIRKVKGLLRELLWRCKSDASWWMRLIKGTFFKKCPLDPRLLQNLSESEKFLKDSYQRFKLQHLEFLKLKHNIDLKVKELAEYSAFKSKDAEEQNRYLEIYRWIRFWEFGLKNHSALSSRVARKIRLISPDGMIKLFDRYLESLQASVYLQSRQLKERSLQSGQEEVKNDFRENSSLFQNESQALLHTIAKYREFLLKNDPNPYMRSRWGFTERNVGPQPLKAKRLSQQVFLCKDIKDQFEHILYSIDHYKPYTEQQSFRRRIDQMLHGISSPLASQVQLRENAQGILDGLKECDLLGSHHPEEVSFTGSVLSKAMRLDWKYHVFHEFAFFQDIYKLYLGLVGKSKDPAHCVRLKKFENKMHQIEGWLDKDDLYSHGQDVMSDINDMKIYLQDFLASIQRFAKEGSIPKQLDKFVVDPDESSRNSTSEVWAGSKSQFFKLFGYPSPFDGEQQIKDFRHYLLEYRYLFGNFFYSLDLQESKGGKQLRTQFLFVDQYFESCEQILQEIME